MNKSYEFNSERLYYRGIREDDAALIVSWRSDPANYINFFSAHPITLEEHMEWYEAYLEDLNRFDFMIFDPKYEPIGTVGISRLEGDTFEASYMIGNASKRGKGYATEALIAISDLAFDVLNANKVITRMVPDNVGSQMVSERAGFEKKEIVYSLERTAT